MLTADCWPLAADRSPGPPTSPCCRPVASVLPRFGKYLNQNPKQPPVGIQAYMANGGGTYDAPQFDTQVAPPLLTSHPPLIMLLLLLSLLLVAN